MTAVITINKGEYGVACVFNTAYDMSSFTTVAMKFTKPDGTILLVDSASNGVTVPNTPIVTVLGTFAANEYARYVFQNGDLDQVGTWYCRVIYDDATPQHLISNQSSFAVTA
jgi:hypothetical protein